MELLLLHPHLTWTGFHKQLQYILDIYSIYLTLFDRKFQSSLKNIKNLRWWYFEFCETQHLYTKGNNYSASQTWFLFSVINTHKAIFLLPYTCYEQCSHKFRLPNRSKLAFLPSANQLQSSPIFFFKVITCQFPKLGCFWAAIQLKSPTQLNCWLNIEWITNIDCSSGHF